MIIKGYDFCIGRKEYFVASDKEIFCKSVVEKLIHAIAVEKNLCDDMVKRMLCDKQLYNELKYRCQKATLEYRPAGFYKITGKNFIACYPVDDMKELTLIN